MGLMRKVYLTQQEMLKFMKEKRQDSLSSNLREYYEARQEMNDWLEKDDVPEDTKATYHLCTAASKSESTKELSC